jgi:predicted GIY-YIG superfamily endonuclease
MKKCTRCGRYRIKNPEHDLCYDCWSEQEDNDETISKEEHFEDNLTFGETHTVYIMFYGNNENKIGYSKDLDSRIIEIKREYPNNKLVYFREFVTETDARRFEAWLKSLTQRELSKFISKFQDRIKKIECF